MNRGIVSFIGNCWEHLVHYYFVWCSLRVFESVWESRKYIYFIGTCLLFNNFRSRLKGYGGLKSYVALRRFISFIGDEIIKFCLIARSSYLTVLVCPSCIICKQIDRLKHSIMHLRYIRTSLKLPETFKVMYMYMQLEPKGLEG